MLLSNRALNYYSPMFIITTGRITLESPIKFAVIPGPRLSFLSHIEVWCFPLQILQVFLLSQSLARSLALVQLKHKRLSARIFFLSFTSEGYPKTSPVFFKQKFSVFNFLSRSAICLSMISNAVLAGSLLCRKREKAVPRFLIKLRFIHLI